MTEAINEFGGPWTRIKLSILDEYLNAYCTIMKRQHFKLVYIDAFAGTGEVLIRGEMEAIEGSARRALKYPFDEYYFIELKESYCRQLKSIADEPEYRGKSIHIIKGNCNEVLESIDNVDWRSNYYRGVIFLDPCAMQLNFDSLRHIARTGILDVWYLFPFSAMNRNLNTNGDITSESRRAISRLLGTEDWYDAFYQPTGQISLFNEETIAKAPVRNIQEYIIKRLGDIFSVSGVSKDALILRNERNSPLFLLCFAVSNPSDSARGIAIRVASHLLRNAEMN